LRNQREDIESKYETLLSNQKQD